jgi:hypothetical protein
MKRKIYEPVTDFERATSYCPLYLAWRILDEARDYFRTPIPEAFADKLAHRAEAVFAHHPFMQRQFKSASGQAAILMFMRHWLAGSLSSVAAHCEGRMLARERPTLFRDLPESFKVGHPLPAHSLTQPALRGHPLPSNERGIKSGGATTPPYHKSKTVGLTCRSAPILGKRGSRGSPQSGTGCSPHHPVSRFVHGCELLPA